MSHYTDPASRNDIRNHTMLRIGAISVTIVLMLLVLLMLLWTPITGPWSRERQGMANLRQAAQDRQILVEQARGELEAAQAQADAIRTMGQAARDFPEYRTQVFVAAFSEALTNGRIERIIYLPTETSMPITEAGRMVEAD